MVCSRPIALAIAMLLSPATALAGPIDERRCNRGDATACIEAAADARSDNNAVAVEKWQNAACVAGSASTCIELADQQLKNTRFSVEILKDRLQTACRHNARQVCPEASAIAANPGHLQQILDYSTSQAARSGFVESIDKEDRQSVSEWLRNSPTAAAANSVWVEWTSHSHANAYAPWTKLLAISPRSRQVYTRASSILATELANAAEIPAAKPKANIGGPEMSPLSYGSLCLDGIVEDCLSSGRRRMSRGDFLAAATIFSLACENGSVQGCELAGLVYLDYLQRPAKAHPYFDQACRMDSQMACHELLRTDPASN